MKDRTKDNVQNSDKYINIQLPQTYNSMMIYFQSSYSDPQIRHYVMHTLEEHP
jgi:hypothetical protein